MANYPGSVALFTTKYDLSDIVFAAHINVLQDELGAVQAILGTLPQTSFPTVKARLLDIETRLAAVATHFNGSGMVPTSGVTGYGTDASLAATLTNIENSLSALSTQITNETSSRSTADGNEATARQAADTTLQNNINSEASARATADTTLRTSLRVQAYEASRSTLHGIPNDTWTELAPDAPNVNLGSQSGFYGGTGGRIFTVMPDYATYLITARVVFSRNNNGLRGIRVISAGGSVIQQFLTEATLTLSDYLSLTSFITHQFQAGYYYAVQVYQNSGGPLALYASSGTNPYSIAAAAIPVFSS